MIRDLPGRLRRHVSSGAYRPEIDGLRFFAIAIVMVGHFFQRAVRFFPSAAAAADDTPFGGALHLAAGLGVALFFAVSGFILASQAKRSRLSPLSGGFLRTYFTRRLLRIEPPYFLVLLATWALLTATGYQPEGTRQFFTEPQSLNLSLLGSLFYVHDLVWGAFPRLFPPGWSLEVEVQFYCIAPLLFWFWFRIASGRLRAALAATVFVASCVASSLALRQVGPVFVYYSLLRYFGFFWLGLALADSRGGAEAAAASVKPAIATMIGWTGLAAFVALPEFPDSMVAGVCVRLVAGVAIVAMFIGALAPRSGFRAFCASPWVSLIGGACYSLYLVHIQIIQTATVFAAKYAPDISLSGVFALMAGEFILVGIAGLLFYSLIERPCMARNWPIRAAARLGLRRADAIQGGAAFSLTGLSPRRLAVARLGAAGASSRVAAARP